MLCALLLGKVCVAQHLRSHASTELVARRSRFFFLLLIFSFCLLVIPFGFTASGGVVYFSSRLFVHGRVHISVLVPFPFLLLFLSLSHCCCGLRYIIHKTFTICVFTGNLPCALRAFAGREMCSWNRAKIGSGQLWSDSYIWTLCTTNNSQTERVRCGGDRDVYIYTFGRLRAMANKPRNEQKPRFSIVEYVKCFCTFHVCCSAAACAAVGLDSKLLFFVWPPQSHCSPGILICIFLIQLAVECAKWWPTIVCFILHSLCSGLVVICMAHSDPL